MGRCAEVVSLTQNCRGGAAPDCVIRPSIVLVIDDMEVPEAAPASVAQHVGLGAHLRRLLTCQCDNIHIIL